MLLIDADKMLWEKARRKLHKTTTNYIEQILKATPHEATAMWPLNLLSLKPSKFDEQDMRDTAGDVRTNL